jgi:hypothetical protein
MILLIALFFCHFLADYTWLSTNWMLEAKRFGKPLFPIFIHAAMHAMLMSVALGLYIGFTDKWAYLVIFQWVSHFAIDVLKGKVNIWFPAVQNPANKWHWIVFGADQFLHAIVIVIMYQLSFHQ